MHETKGADAPAIPALDKTLGTDEQIDRGTGQVDLPEHRLGKLGFQDRDVVEPLLSDMGRQARCVADVDESERLFGLTDTQHDLVLVALDPGNRQLTTGPVLKELFENVAKQVAGLPALPKHE